MRRTSPPTERSRQRGFTLIEMIVSLVVMSLVALVMIPMLRMPMDAYGDASRRVELQSQMELVRSKLADDLSRALPGSVRVRQVGAVYYLEYLEVRAWGHYETASTTTYCTAACSGDAFQPSCSTESCMTTQGPLTALNTGASAPVVGSDYLAYMPGDAVPALATFYTVASGSPMSRLTAAAPVANGMGFKFTAHQFPTSLSNNSLQNRFYIVQQPVSYVCTPNATGTGTLVKRWGYALAAVQPTGAFPAGTQTSNLTSQVAACSINAVTATTAPLNLRTVVAVQLRLSGRTGGGPAETVESLLQSVVKEP